MSMNLWLLATMLLCVNCLEKSAAISSRDYEERRQESLPFQNPEEISGVIDLSHEECRMNGDCTIFKKFVKKLPISSPWQPANQEDEMRSQGSEVWSQLSRPKRKIFGADNRLRIRAPYNRAFPFSSTIAVGHGNVTVCSGVALTHNMTLTAAHCLLSSSGDIVSDLRVGVLGRDGAMKWTKVKKTKYHVTWKREKRRRAKGKLDARKFLYDYAVLETVSSLHTSTMTIAVVGKDDKGKERLIRGKTYIHFSAFDDVDPSVLRYRFCKVEKVNRRRIFSKCDTVTKTAGAGVYVLMRNKNTGKVERKVIAIETGDYRKRYNEEVMFSSARRITRLQFVQICFWVTNDFGKCSGTEF